MKTERKWDVIIIGAGAAGMMCAARAGQGGRSVLLMDHAQKLGEKIRISGGGHCNFTNLHCAPENFLSLNPEFCRSALARFTPRHFIQMVERHQIPYHEKHRGQLFCDGSAVQIIHMLQAECEVGHVAWRMPCRIEGVFQKNGQFVVATEYGDECSGALVVATGGLSIPRIGASPFAYRVAEQFGLDVVPPRPGLVPLSTDPDTMAGFGDLSGISMPVEVSCHEASFRESLLFTHQGLSGPAILQISSYWNRGEFICLNLLPDQDIPAWLSAKRSSRGRVDNLLVEVWPRRFAQQWCAAHGLDRWMSQLTAGELQQLGQSLGNWRIKPSGTLGYNKAEVTVGGVDTRGLSSKTMESRAVPGLYFIGEAVDVTGQLGGFNFQWAWSSGHAAGLALSS